MPESIITPLVAKGVTIHSKLFPYLCTPPLHFEIDERNLLITFLRRSWGKHLHSWTLFVVVIVYIINIGCCGFISAQQFLGWKLIKNIPIFEKLFVIALGCVVVGIHGGMWIFLQHPELQHGFNQILLLEKKCTQYT